MSECDGCDAIADVVEKYIVVSVEYGVMNLFLSLSLADHVISCTEHMGPEHTSREKILSIF